MSNIDRRRRGRAVRRAQRMHGPTAGVVFIDLALDLRSFTIAVDRAARAMGLFGRAARSRRQLLHNGRKP